MTGVGELLVLGTVVCDVVGQLCFKRGTTDPTGHWASAPLVWIGVAVYAVEFGLWSSALSWLPLSRAVPIGALAYVGVVLASRVVLNEPIAPRRWIGTALVAGGVALAGTP